MKMVIEEFPYDTPSVEMEEGVSDRNYYKNEKRMREKRKNSQITLLMLRCRKV